MNDRSTAFSRLLIGMACFVIVVAGIKAAASLLTPFLLAVFLAIILTPLYFSMMKVGMPSWLSLLVIILGFGVVSAIAVVVGGRALVGFAADLPQYQQGLQYQTMEFVGWLRERGVEAPEQIIRDAINPQAFIGFLSGTVSTLTDLASQAFIIFFIVVFIILEAALLPDRIRQIPNINPDTMKRLQVVTEKLRGYLAIKTLMSLLTGGLVLALLLGAGVRNALILALFAFLLNYIPNVGSFLASIPAILLAMVDFGIVRAGIVAAGYLAINVGVSNGIEPRFMGRGLGLSPLIIVLNMVFWAWVLGPVGMLLAVPLAMIVKIVLEGFSETRGAAILMGPLSITQPENNIPEKASSPDKDKS
ncbi:MAG: AI-2E family transporter [Verrucomicrobiota bacterium]